MTGATASVITSGAPASLPRRLGALLYEALLLIAVVFISGFALLPLTSPHAAGGGVVVPALPVRVMIFGLTVAVLAVYCVTFWTGGRRTLAMKTWRLRVVRRNGLDLDRRTALLRFLAGWIGPGLGLLAYGPLHQRGHGLLALCFFALNYIWALFDPDRQFLHDRLAGTCVVRESRSNADTSLPAGRVTVTPDPAPSGATGQPPPR